MKRTAFSKPAAPQHLSRSMDAAQTPARHGNQAALRHLDRTLRRKCESCEDDNKVQHRSPGSAAEASVAAAMEEP